MKSIVRGVRISPKKLSVIASIVRGMDAKHALDLLRFMPKKGSRILFKALESAVANAKNNDQQSVENLLISVCNVTQGTVYKRINPISR
jgi:large subunit ribosomal protein L22